MTVIRNLIFTSLLLANLSAIAETKLSTDDLVRAPDLTLGQLIDDVLETYPGYAEFPARLEEAGKLDRKASNWFSSTPSVDLRYQTGEVGNNNLDLREYEAFVELPLWRFGERKANRGVAREAGQEASTYGLMVRWQLAGVLRDLLWDIDLTNDRVERAVQALQVSEELLHGVSRRTELGDLARGDLLQAQQDKLVSELRLLTARTDYANATYAYRIVTGLGVIPTAILEERSSETAIGHNHPALASSYAALARAHAEYDVTQESGIQSPAIALGVKAVRVEDDFDLEDSVGIIFSYPFGGGAHVDALVASARVRVAGAKSTYRSQRMSIELDFRKAERNLLSREQETALAAQRRELAEQNLRMSQQAFDLGDIGLLEFLIIKNIAFNAESEAREKEILWRTAISNYNQAVGDIP